MRKGRNSMNYYDILEISPNASDEVIKAAYRSLVKKYHPDAGREVDGEKFSRIEKAYNVLSDEKKRKEYDLHLSTRNTDTTEKKEQRSKYTPTVWEKEKSDYNRNTYKSNSGSSFSGFRNKLSGMIDTILGLAFLGFIIWCLFIGNGEKLKMNLLNLIGQQEYSKEGPEYNVGIYTKYDDAFLSSDPDVWLNVDGERVALLSAGKQNIYTAKLHEGKHIVFVESKFWHANSEKLYIDVTQDNIFYFTIEADGWAPDITNGF